MSRYNQPEAPPVSYPPPPMNAYPAAGKGSHVTAPPPMGYPTRDATGYPQQSVPDQTTSRGDGFWKGCCAALCCCCVLDCMF